MRAPSLPSTPSRLRPHHTHTHTQRQKWGSKQAGSFQVIDAAAGTLENVVDLGFAQLRAQADCAADGDARTDVKIGGAVLTLGGGLRVPLPVKGTGFVDWLYLSERLRVTRGSKGSLFVHVREAGPV
jgi:hypothetical protein